MKVVNEEMRKVRGLFQRSKYDFIETGRLEFRRKDRAALEVC